MHDVEKKTLLALAREAIESTCRGSDTPLYDQLKKEDKDPYAREQGCFVTIHTREGSLRGCIGNLWGRGPLYEEVFKLAKQAAFNDPRFHPVQEEELTNLVLEISVLGSMQALDAYQQIQLGKDGVLLSHGYHRAVFLPQVATQQGWDLDTMLSHLSAKAGLPPSAYRDEACHFEVFQADVFGEP